MIEQSYVLVHFKLSHQIPYGKAIYILGNYEQLGNWKPNAETRLDWTHSHNWRKSFILPKQHQLEYKYLVGDYNQVNSNEIEWQTGANRIMDLAQVNLNQIFLSILNNNLDQKWNIIRIKIILCTPLNVEEVTVTGNCPDLGMRISKIKLNQEKEYNLDNPESQKVWSITFDTSKYKKCLNYYYHCKIDGVSKSTRQPGKHYFVKNCHSEDNLLGRIQVDYLMGEIIIVQYQDFKGFKITKLSEHLFIGPYVKTIDDIHILNQNKIKAVLNLQTKQDMRKYQIDWIFIKQQTSKLGIQSFNFEIIDMNFFDFIKKASQALKLLKDILKQYKSVYVHCTAGIFRSPQLVILYLVKFMNYNLNDAIELIRSKRPFIVPYIEGIRNILNNVYNQFKIKRI